MSVESYEDFNKWLVKLGLRPIETQPQQQKANLIILKSIYDQITDLQIRLEYIEKTGVRKE